MVDSIIVLIVLLDCLRPSKVKLLFFEYRNIKPHLHRWAENYIFMVFTWQDIKKIINDLKYSQSKLLVTVESSLIPAWSPFFPIRSPLIQVPAVIPLHVAENQIADSGN